MNVRRVVRRVGWGLIWSALLIFAFLGYQLFVTDLLNDRVQAAAEADLAEDLAERREDLPEPEIVTVELPPDDPADTPTSTTPTSTSTTVPPVEFSPEEAGEEGSTLGRIAIPSLDVDEVLFEGVTRETLNMGPGHMPWTPVPGQPGNAVISGHRTTYGRPFYDLDKLEMGDRIEVETAVGLHVFEVREIHIVEPTDVWVTEPIPGAWLTLTTCHPRFSAAERLIIQAEMVEGPNLEYASLLAQVRDGNEERT
ncbi:MAG TPA: class E sortase [Acidimicrobiia bacterium]|nr:class E sortase [Acidimicrobiia bacterium]